MHTQPLPLTRYKVLTQSGPIMLANAAGPVVGLVDTFVIGRYASTVALAGIGLGAIIYSIAYWGFGFLRMSTAGLAAQSDGAQNEAEVQTHLFRALPLALMIGVMILVLQPFLLSLAFMIFTAPPDVEMASKTYIQARLWGLPATLGIIALMGWFIGLSKSQYALIMQLILNLINALLSFGFVAGLGWGLYGAGIASALAEWAGLLAGIILTGHMIRQRGGLKPGIFKSKTLLNPGALRQLGITNGNIFIRTMALTFGFNFFCQCRRQPRCDFSGRISYSYAVHYPNRFGAGWFCPYGRGCCRHRLWRAG